MCGGGAYEAAIQAAALPEVPIWFDLAHAVLGGLSEKYAGLEPSPSPVRCWPHHFDIATLISLDAGGGEETRSVGVGMTPGDGGYAQPYFYVTPWPYPGATSLPPLREPAFWHTEGWAGAVIEGTALIETEDAEGRRKRSAPRLKAPWIAACPFRAGEGVGHEKITRCRLERIGGPQTGSGLDRECGSGGHPLR